MKLSCTLSFENFNLIRFLRPILLQVGMDLSSGTLQPFVLVAGMKVISLKGAIMILFIQISSLKTLRRRYTLHVGKVSS